jgi:GNAT superfamily N-acetyltransferase
MTRHRPFLDAFRGSGRVRPAVGLPAAPASRRLAAVMGDATLVIEAATAADAPAVIGLIGRVFEEYAFVFDPVIELPDLLAFDRHYTSPGAAFFVARLGGAVVGSVAVERLDGRTAELHRLYLEAHLRGRGLGRSLVEVVLDWCRGAGIPHLVLWSDTRFDRAHALYERMGFVRTGERTLAGDVNNTREFRYEREV